MVKILIVEDDPMQLEGLAKILRGVFPAGEILTVASLVEAKTTLDAVRSVSLVLTDYKLADGTGYELLQHCNENLINTPVILMTAYGQSESEEVRAALSFQKGVFDFINKPIIDYPELIERIKHALRIAEALA
jgi:DNA-binding NtrC family response regulator